MESEGQPKPLTVLVIEDHAIVRDGCRRICNRRPEFTVVEAASAEEGLNSNRRFRPDVIILDIDLSGTSGFDIMPTLLADNPKARVVVFSMYETARFVTKALELGAVGYITKSDEPNILLTAIDKASRREIFLSPTVARAPAIDESTADADPMARLTEREREVFALIGDGKEFSEIAERLEISQKTVANTVALIKPKLNVTSLPALIKLAVEAKANR